MAQIINYQELWERIKEYTMKVGRVAVRPVLCPTTSCGVKIHRGRTS